MGSSMFGLTLTLLLVLSSCQAGLVHRHNREIESPNEVAAVPVVLSEPVASELRKDQIPVQVIQLQEPEPVQNQGNVDILAVVAEPAEPVAKPIETLAQVSQDDKGSKSSQVAKIAEEIAQAVETEQKLDAAAAVIEAEQNKPIVQEVVEKDANKELLRSTAPVEGEAVVAAESVQQPVKEIVEDAKPDAVVSADSVPAAEIEQSQPVLLKDSLHISADDPVPNERQVTQATPTQTTTQTNFMQQLIQPIGQFISQITGQQQPQQQQPTGQVPVNDGTNPGPSLPGFLNPSNAISTAQQAVQTVVNSTSQAFQGLQQFASNIGTSFQNTLSNLGGQQQQLSAGGSTTPRPPGPLQSLVNNFIGGGNNQQQASTPAQQPQGPLQGIISFFQGGNRPTVAAVIAPSEQLTTSIASSVDNKVGVDQQPLAENAEVTNEVRNSAEVVNEEPVDEAPGSQDDTANEIASSVEVVDEVPNSEEAVNNSAADSVEEAKPEEIIVVNEQVADEQVAA